MAQDWTGFYFGANLGGVWGNSDADATVSCPGTGYLCTPAVAPANGPVIAATGTNSLDGDGVVGGVQAGYNMQSGHFVYGFEIDLSALDLDTSKQVNGNFATPPLPGSTFTIGSALATNWLFTARGRLGWTVSNTLMYATGGLALTSLELTSNYSDTAGGSMFARNTDTKVGFVVGGGAEWVLTGNWTLKGEYLYVDFGSVTALGLATNAAFPVAGAATPIGVSGDLSEHIGRAGFNYRFQNPN